MSVWTEKYRPKVWSQIQGNEEIISRLKQLKYKKDYGSLLFVGPPGVAKTTCAICLALDSLGSVHMKEGLLHLNASDSRTLHVVQERIVPFTKKKVSWDSSSSTENNKKRFVILDELDSMPMKSQQALRSLMKATLKSTHFLIICNDIKKVLEPIRSQCVPLRFHALPSSCILKQLSFIAEKEKLCENKDYDVKALEIMAKSARGDMRKALNYFEITQKGLGTITVDNLSTVIDNPSNRAIQEILMCCAQNKLAEALKALHGLISKEGFPVEEILVCMIETVQEIKQFSAMTKLSYTKEMAKISERFKHSCATVAQLSALLCMLTLMKVDLIL